MVRYPLPVSEWNKQWHSRPTNYTVQLFMLVATEEMIRTNDIVYVNKAIEQVLYNESA